MYVMIVGGGKIGSHLAKLLLAEGHEVKVIDYRPEVLDWLHKELPAECIVEGDGSSPGVLEAAGIQRAKVLAAVMAEDEANLVITSLARFEFNVPRTIARVNNPKNGWMFNAEMGVDVALDQADILAHLVADELSLSDMTTLLKLRRGQYSIVEEKLPSGSPLLAAPLKDLPVPDQCVITAVLRRGEVMIPHGELCFEPGDEVLAIVEDEAIPSLRRLFGGA